MKLANIDELKNRIINITQEIKKFLNENNFDLISELLQRREKLLRELIENHKQDNNSELREFLQVISQDDQLLMCAIETEQAKILDTVVNINHLNKFYV